MNLDLRTDRIAQLWRGRRRLAGVALLLALGAPSTAAAQDEPASDFDLAALVRPGVYLPVGASVGGAYRQAASDGLTLGAEASVVSFGQVGPPGTWFGGYTDGCWDFGVNAFRHSTGPQFGIAMLGLDLGYLGELRDGAYRPGFSGRGFLTLGVVSAFGRYGRLYGRRADADEDVAEFGVLAKWPVRLGGVTDTTERPSESAGTKDMLRF